MTKSVRTSWDEYFMSIAQVVATRSTCVRRSVGAVLVKGKVILSTGYNGAPKGLKHCTEQTCVRTVLEIPSGEQQQLCRAVHAEQNAIIQCAMTGTPCKGSTLYCTTFPCSICAKMLINAGIHKIVYDGGYPDKMAKELLTEAGIFYTRIEL